MIEKLTKEDVDNFRFNFRTLRVKRNIEQKELAQLMHITQQDVSGIEHNRKRVTVELIESAAEALNVSVDELLAEVTVRATVSNIAMRLFAIAERMYRASLDPQELQVIAKSVDAIEAIISH